MTYAQKLQDDQNARAVNLINRLRRAKGKALARSNLIASKAYPSMKDEPLRTPVMFANDVIRANALLRGTGSIIRMKNESYWMELRDEHQS